MTTPFRQSDLLNDAGIVRHGFFGRQGGVSEGEFAGLNVSLAVGDEPEAVHENRRLVADAMGGGPLVLLKQVHSNRIVTVDDGPLPDAVEADALVTRRPDVLLGILTADCAPLLFLDRHAGVVGAAHAGWRGAVDGILDNTIRAMEALGAERHRIYIEIGPTISGRNYEVGPDFMRQALAIAPDAEASFTTPPGGRAHFDLPGFLLRQGAHAAPACISTLDTCTYADPEQYFSHRYATHNGTRTGRQVAVIGLG